MAVKAEKASSDRSLEEHRRVVVHLPTLVKVAELFITFFLGAILSSAQVLGQAAPFGVALVASSGAGVGGLAALLGVCFGSLSVGGFTEGLRYTASAVLLFSVSFAFYDLKIFAKPWFMPVMAALLSGCTGFVYLSAGRWTAETAILFAVELLLTAGAAYFYRIALCAWKTRGGDEALTLRQTASGLILALCVLVALQRLALPFELSAGRLCGSLCVLIAAYLKGSAPGATLGLCCGIAMDLSLGGVPFYSMAYGFSGLLAGVFWKQGKGFCALSYLLGSAVAVLWAWNATTGPLPFFETALVAALFLLLPQRLLRRISAGFPLDREKTREDRSPDYVRDQLSATAAAFSELQRSLQSAFQRKPENRGDPATVFDRAATHVCPGCALRDTCWQREYSATYAALNDALPAMVDRGRGVAADFPLHFRSRCLKFPTFLTAANEELSAWLTRNQYECRLGESRSAVCRQYSQVAEILTRASLELSSDLTPDTRRQRLLQQYLLGHDLDGETTAFYDENGLLRMELEGRSLDILAKSPHPAALAKLLSLPLRPATVTKTPRGTRVVFLQAPPLAAQTALAARPKDGETVSGDGGTFLLLENGTLYALLCDGMGAGEGAHRESALALHLLEQFLKAGVDTEAALKTLNSALALRWEAEGGFTTVDLLRLDLVRGEGCIYKYGAAPSYLLYGGTVSRLSGSALPAGLLAGEETAPDRLPFQVSPGDRIVLLSDGISAEEDSWLREALTDSSFADPKALAQLIVTRPQPGTPSDDKTALVVQIVRR